MRDLVTRQFWCQGVPLWRVVLITLCLGTLPGIASSVVLNHNQHANDRNLYIRVCERNNYIKAESRIAVHENKASPPSLVNRREKLYVILDCAATFNHGGRGVPLTHDQERKYLEVIRRARIPLLRHGEVIGSREPEQGNLADF
jgi:hypothetical protein